jgi:hypothetical protein
MTVPDLRPVDSLEGRAMPLEDAIRDALKDRCV